MSNQGVWRHKVGDPWDRWNLDQNSKQGPPEYKALTLWAKVAETTIFPNSCRSLLSSVEKYQVNTNHTIGPQNLDQVYSTTVTENHLDETENTWSPE
jgi:hypothetical protein